MEYRDQQLRSLIFNALNGVCDQNDKVLVIYSSLIHIGILHPNLKWDFLWALKRLIDRGQTLALPTFTFSFIQGKSFHLEQSPSETGQLGEWVLELRGAARTANPIYSFAVVGPLKQKLLDSDQSVAFGDHSIFAVFDSLNARIIMLGCGWPNCTQFHHYEEEAKVPYRYYKQFTGQADLGAGAVSTRAKMYVRNLDVDPRNNFSPAVEEMKQSRLIQEVPLGNAYIESALCLDLANNFRKLLKKDTYAFVRNRAQIAYKVINCEKRNSSEAFKIALIGHRNLEMLHSEFREVLSLYLQDRSIKFYVPPYGQVSQEIIREDSALNKFNAHLTVFFDRWEDMLGIAQWEKSPQGLGNWQTHFGRNLELMADYVQRAAGMIIINRYTVIDPGSYYELQQWQQIVDSMNIELYSRFKDFPKAWLFDLANTAAMFTDGAVIDRRLWFLGRFPFSKAFTQYLAGRYTAMILASLGKITRLIVVDLDNTLWGGVLGENGLSKLNLGGDYPGNAYYAFQKALKKLTEQGVSLVICSKNDEKEALEAIDKLHDMVLKERDFVDYRINWEPKWKNVLSVAENLNLGLEHILFIDDNPVEREQMRQHLPAVKVLDLTKDPSDYVEILQKSIYLEFLSITQEDVKRTKSYRTRHAVEKQRQLYDNIESFYASLKTEVHIYPLLPENTARAVQLLSKTNQFNTTTRRYNQSDLESFSKEGINVYVVGACDRFSELENIGILIIRWNVPKTEFVDIDSFLLSCRVLGRGIERGILGWLKEEAMLRKIKMIRGLILPTERNIPVRELFKENEFVPGGTHEWLLELTTEMETIPKWINVINHCGD